MPGMSGSRDPGVGSVDDRKRLSVVPGLRSPDTGMSGLRDPVSGGDHSKKACIALCSMRIFVFPMFLKGKPFRRI